MSLRVMNGRAARSPSFDAGGRKRFPAAGAKEVLIEKFPAGFYHIAVGETLVIVDANRKEVELTGGRGGIRPDV
jgi:hypothetical protein